jgi:hypothetical protein
MTRQWYYAQNGQQLGPVSGEQLRAMLVSGSVRPTDLVWTDSLPAWTPASQVPALLPAPAPAPAPVYVPPPAPAPVYTPPPPAQAAPAPAPRPAPAAAPTPAPQPAWTQSPAPEPVQGGGDVSQEVVELLRKTKPWVRFLSVLGFIALVFILLAAVAIVALPTGPMGAMAIGPKLAAAGAYILMGLLQFPALLFLSRYASRIKDLVNSGHPQDLEDALAAQKSFWKYVGIFTLVMIIVYILGIAAVLIFMGTAMFGR